MEQSISRLGFYRVYLVLSAILMGVRRFFQGDFLPTPHNAYGQHQKQKELQKRQELCKKSFMCHHKV